MLYTRIINLAIRIECQTVYRCVRARVYSILYCIRYILLLLLLLFSRPPTFTVWHRTFQYVYCVYNIPLTGRKRFKSCAQTATIIYLYIYISINTHIYIYRISTYYTVVESTKRWPTYHRVQITHTHTHTRLFNSDFRGNYYTLSRRIHRRHSSCRVIITNTMYLMYSKA